MYNYVRLVRNGAFLTAFANSVVMVGASVIRVLLIGVPASYVLSRWDLPERNAGGHVWILHRGHLCKSSAD